MSLLRSILTIGGLTSISRVFGFIRDTLIAAFLGAGPVADAFFVALRFPNLFRSLFAEGAFSAAFVPIFVGTLTTDGRDQALAFAERAMAVLTTVLLVFVLAVEILMPLAMMALAPGFIGTQTFDLAVTFSRLTFPYLLFISLTALQGGVLNALGRFAAPAATPILLNLSLIAALTGTGPLMPTPGHALAWGLVIAGIVQFLWLMGSCGREGVWLRMPAPRLTPDVRRLLRRALPVAFGAGVYQVNVMTGTVLASLLPSGAVSYLFYADRLSQLPYGIIGVAVSTALLPLLSRQLRTGDAAGALHSQNRALEFAIFLMLPAAAALVVLAAPIIDVLFRRGAFSPADVSETAAALAAFAVGLPALMLVKSLTPGFYAREDTSTPVKIAALSAVVNVAVAAALMGPMKHVGIALAASIANWLNAVLLAVVLYRRGFLRTDARLRARVPRTLLATAAMTGALWGLGRLTEPWLAGAFVARAAVLAALIAAGIASFGLFAHMLGAVRREEVLALFRRGQRAA
ncbi:MAG: murein biosynthesis integral membrane protein MurJ [Rhodospirillales bacterium]|nr:murein biosynthesis integral membrane protein MurJ [Rhodospirillales bacterium]